MGELSLGGARSARVWANCVALSLALAALIGCAGPLPKTPATPPASGADLEYRAELIARAAEMRLWERHYWHVLLHYGEDLFTGYTSEADGPGFFLAPAGRTDPRAELKATIAGFFSEAIIEPGKQTAQCTLIARYHWLDGQLGFDRARMPEHPCERYWAWRGALDPGSVTLIYASYYFNNPSSMFGHTLLRIDKRGRAEEQRLLDYTVTYGAVVPEDEGGLLWALNGLVGGYDGYFTVLPYYIKVKEYSDFESRDLWEYRLDFNDAELDRLMRHLWEMGSTYFNYYFFKENCSYHLLSLLEAARPELDLRSRFLAWTLPTATVDQVLRVPGLVESVTYRPSRGSVIRWRLDELTPDRREMVFALAADSGEQEGEPFQALPVAGQAAVLDTAIDLHQFELAGQKEPPPEQKAELRRLLLARSRLGFRQVSEERPPRPAPLEAGHGSSRLFLGGGGDNENRTYYELGFQPAFHDLMAREDGYAPNSQILGITSRLRYETEVDEVRVEQFDLINIVSLFPLGAISKQFSWRARAGWERSRDLGCEACAPFVLDGGIGLTLESHWLSRETFFILLEPELQVEGLFDRGYRVGAGGTIGILFEITAAYRIALTATQRAFFAGHEDTVVESGAVRQRLSLSQNFDLRLDWKRVEDYREATLGLSWFF